MANYPVNRKLTESIANGAGWRRKQETDENIVAPPSTQHVAAGKSGFIPRV
jgi:hypothetical protein